ncbi:MAG: hypothetical protein ACI8XB_001369 [Patiriisocius sp.]|jgi:hypothetical protein
MNNRQLVVAVLVSVIFYCLEFRTQSNPSAESIHDHLEQITKTDGFRTHDNLPLLNKTAAYIYNHFSQYADTTYFQKYSASDKVYKNVVCRFGDIDKPTIIIGAHYDVCGAQEGADDNASGVVGLLELAVLLKSEKLDYCIELVAYTLEEPPYFRTEKMGSYIHAESLIAQKRNIYGMISLEMIGYFDDAKKSQKYPLGVLSWIYGNKGDYITLVNKFGKGKFARKFSKKFRSNRKIRTKKFTGPKSMPGIDFSDHLNYWAFGLSAMMITDTAFYRNMNYHRSNDKMEVLDLERMSRVIETVFVALKKLK